MCNPVNSIITQQSDILYYWVLSGEDKEQWWQFVRSAGSGDLHPAKFTLNQFTQCLDRACLGHSWQPFHEDMAIGKKCDEQ